MKKSIKVTVCTMLALLLFISGYCSGLFVQYKRDTDFHSARNMTELIQLEKLVSVGDNEATFHRLHSMMTYNSMQMNSEPDFYDLRILVRDSFTGGWEAGWHRAALASIIGMRRVRQDVVFPSALEPELAAFVPRDSDRRVLDLYASTSPASR